MNKQKLYIVKIGGNVINNNSELGQFLAHFAAIDGPKLLVHGGGKVLDELAEKLELPQQMVNGRRITDAETLRLAVMVYAGLLNKQLVADLQAKGTQAIGLSGADANCIPAIKRRAAEQDFGFVGDVNPEAVNTEFISMLLEAGIAPVFCAVTHDGKGQLLNTNADTQASALAIAMSKQYDVQLIYCFEKRGVLQDPQNDASFIPTITRDSYQSLKEQAIVSKGMIPKLDNAFSAIGQGVETVVIAHADYLMQTLDLNEHAGTYLVA